MDCSSSSSPYHDKVQQHFGHVLDVLAGLSDKSVQMIATSPPYFGLRDYGLSPVIWAPAVYAPMTGLPEIRVPSHADAAAFANCSHEWGEWTEKRDVRETTAHGKTRTTDRYFGNESRRFDGNHQKHSHGQFCSRCGAWRGCLGLEPNVDLYVAHLVQVFREARRVLSDDGTLWLNLGDSYSAGARQGPSCDAQRLSGNQGIATPRHNDLKPKDLIGIPWRAALALQADGWYLRSDVVWAKGMSLSEEWHGNAMPESVTDRPTRAHEFVFLLSKSSRYYYDHVAVREATSGMTRGVAALFKRDKPGKRSSPVPGQTTATHRTDRPDVHYDQEKRNLRDVWAVNTEPYAGAHFAVWPTRLVSRMVAAGTSQAGHCPVCAARWLRRKEASRTVEPSGAAIGGYPQRLDGGTRVRAPANSGGGNVLAALRRWSTEFEPGCECGAEPVSDVVLDLFGGSGTTARVACAQGRRAILIEANPAYESLQRERLMQNEPEDDPAQADPRQLSLLEDQPSP